ncbi:MAG: preprotein translocase subunit SecA, partial [Bacteroidales bacterium]
MELLTSILSRFFGNKSEKDIKNLQPQLEQIKKYEQDFSQLSTDSLREETQKLKKHLQEALQPLEDEIAELKKQAENDTIELLEREKIYEKIDRLQKQTDEIIKEKLDEILPQAFAIVKETAKRFTNNQTIKVDAKDFDRELALKRDFVTIEGNKAIYKNTWMAGGNQIQWNMIHYDVQLIGGMILHKGCIAEMATGEGKTLVATLPIFLNALAGRGVHIVTVNDYLAKRDSEWMGPIFEFHGLRVDCIDKYKPNTPERRNAYLADITYGTNNEFGFDYLRDNMAISPEDLVQRKHNYAIIDEVDSVLIDDARTPLIISGPVPQSADELFNEYRGRVEKLYNAQKNYVNKILSESKRLINSIDKKEQEEGAKLLFRAYKGLPKNTALIKFLSEPGIRTILQKTENFYIQENNKNMPIITDELFFVIDEKHNSIELTEKGIDFISADLDDKTFFILPDIGVSLSDIERTPGTIEEKLSKKDSLLQDYSLKAERVHVINQLLKAYTLFEKDVEYVVMDNKIKIVDEQTGRIMEGRRYSDGLHQAIEAKERVKVEAATQTFATITLQNYFRMYKKLAGMTGTAETEAKELWDIYKLEVIVTPTNKPIIRKDFQDLVYKTRREKYNAIIEHIIELNKLGRPVLVGTTSVETSELLSRMLTRQKLKHNVLNAKLHQKEADIVAEAGREGAITIATNMAGRGTDIKISEEVKQKGGLAIIGTERHESRRVDRQLRGRAGRQGDPGSSQFFVSLEDDLMRMFGSDRIARIMDTLGIKEGEVIQHSMITKSIERAQKKVEENHFGVRKRLLEYDDVMNSQREVVYTKRRHALFGERIDIDFADMLYDVCSAIVQQCHGNTDYTEFTIELIRILSTQSPISEKQYLSMRVFVAPQQTTRRLFIRVW